jgi:hypothetical protein
MSNANEYLLTIGYTDLSNNSGCKESLIAPGAFSG